MRLPTYSMLFVFFGVWAVWTAPAFGQGDLMVYPAKGQSPEQQSKDRYECHTWAVQQTGYDPTNLQASQAPVNVPPPPPGQAPQGGLLRGGARGAAVGAVGGAIAGDAGKGAAIGAATGALLGGMRRRDQVRQEEYEQQQYQQQVAQAQAQANAATAAKQNEYRKAMSACLEGRGYSVK